MAPTAPARYLLHFCVMSPVASFSCDHSDMRCCFCCELQLSQDLSQPPNVEYDDSVSNEAVARIFKFGLPAAALFGLVALLLWRRMEGFDFHAVPSQDSEENRP